MRGFFDWLDELAGIEKESGAVAWLERVAFVFLILMVLAAPHSIAATQTAWIAGMFLWLVSVGLRKLARGRLEENRRVGKNRRHQFFVRRGALDVALWAFFLWSAVTSLTSYAPDISIDKLRGASVFLIFYFVVYNLRNLRAVHFLALALIASCMVNVLWMPVQKLFGRGVEIHGLATGSPFSKAFLLDGDTLLAADGKKLTTPEEVLAVIQQSDVTLIKFYRPDFETTVDVKRSDLLPGLDAMQQLGIQSWKKSHNWRSSGFYGHYTTYAEVLQLIGSLVFGLFIAGILTNGYEPERLRFSPINILMFVCLAAISLALLLTVTRASQLGLLVSAFAIVAFAGSRKMLLGLAAVALPVVIGGLIFLQQSRNVSFLDSKDDSTIYRQTMWRDGFRLWTENPRNFTVGVGMDSIQRYWRDWDLFDGGKLPMGHFHSTPMQLLVERGLPALLLWFSILGIYTWIIWNGLKAYADSRGWMSRGILLGCLGGAIGFFTSGLVHYNLGDQEVAMMFFLLMGLGVRTTELETSNKKIADSN
jgi:hypothetical protein